MTQDIKSRTILFIVLLFPETERNMSITVFALASIANLSVGFDLLGLAIQPVDGTLLGDTVTVVSSVDQKDRLHVEGRFAGNRLPARRILSGPVSEA